MTVRTRKSNDNLSLDLLKTPRILLSKTWTLSAYITGRDNLLNAHTQFLNFEFCAFFPRVSPVLLNHFHTISLSFLKIAFFVACTWIRPPCFTRVCKKLRHGFVTPWTVIAVAFGKLVNPICFFVRKEWETNSALHERPAYDSILL